MTLLEIPAFVGVYSKVYWAENYGQVVAHRQTEGDTITVDSLNVSSCPA